MKSTMLVIICCLLFSFTPETDENSKYVFDLKDGETLLLADVFNNVERKDMIPDLHSIDLNSVIVRSYETEVNSANDFVDYTNHIARNRSLGYWSIVPYTYYGDRYSNTRISSYTYALRNDDNSFDWPCINGFSDYYHSIFRNKVARTFLFNQALSIVQRLCNTYPSDFRTSVLNEISSLIRFSEHVHMISPATDTEKLDNYWQGFILRRHYVDEIPSDEILSALERAFVAIDEIDVSNQPKAMIEVSINDQLSLYYTQGKLTLSSKDSLNEIEFGYATNISEIKYLVDTSGEYYLLIGTDKSGPFRYLYDKNLVEINGPSGQSD